MFSRFAQAVSRECSISPRTLGAVTLDHKSIGGHHACVLAYNATELVESDWLTFDATAFELTERGTIAFTALSEVVEGLRGTVAQGLSPEEYAATVASLETMARNLGYYD